MFPDTNEDQASAIRSDEFYGKPLARAVQLLLQRRGQACSVEEILRSLEKGGFDFRTLSWREGDRLRSLAISLAKNNKVFHKLPNGTFGLLSQYPDVLKDKNANADKPESQPRRKRRGHRRIAKPEATARETVETKNAVRVSAAEPVGGATRPKAGHSTEAVTHAER